MSRESWAISNTSRALPYSASAPDWDTRLVSQALRTTAGVHSYTLKPAAACGRWGMADGLNRLAAQPAIQVPGVMADSTLIILIRIIPTILTLGASNRCDLVFLMPSRLPVVDALVAPQSRVPRTGGRHIWATQGLAATAPDHWATQLLPLNSSAGRRRRPRPVPIQGGR
jgi:hypothetical protein